MRPFSDPLQALRRLNLISSEETDGGAVTIFSSVSTGDQGPRGRTASFIGNLTIALLFVALHLSLGLIGGWPGLAAFVR